MIIIKDGVTIIKRHWIILFFAMVRFAVFFGAWILIYYFAWKVPAHDYETTLFILAIIFALTTYAFIKLVLNIIWYNFNIIIFIRNKVILIRSTILLVDDVEIIDISKIMKVDVECRGIIPNMLNYWHLTIEQQKNDVRVFHFVPDPYQALKILEMHRDMVHSKHPEIRQNIIERIKKSWLLQKK